VTTYPIQYTKCDNLPHCILYSWIFLAIMLGMFRKIQFNKK